MHPDIPEEQAYFDRALELRERVETNRGRAARMAADPKTATELRRRVGALGVVDPGAAVAFGRIDAGGSRWYIGKSAIWDEQNELVVVNWQAPIAAPFYTATPDDPEGLEARRIYRCESNEILDIEEMVLAGLASAVRNGVRPSHGSTNGHAATGVDDTDPGAGSLDSVDRRDSTVDPRRPRAGGGLPGPEMSDALLSSLGQSRSGELRDIVATIQAAQYDIITRDIEQLLVVQGGPGTGKTVVGLHRVSWMLYHRRDQWQANDVLVVGPNPAFVRYISSVLPSLGDEAVVQLPVTALGPQVKVGRTDPAELRTLKGDRRMLRLLLRGVRNRQKPQRGPIDVGVAGRTVRLDGDRIVGHARQLAGQPHNEARRSLRSFILDEVQTFFSRRGLRGLAAIEDMAQSEASREIDGYLDRIWPSMTPQGFLVDLFSTPRRLESAGVGLLTAEEIAMLSIPADATVSTWTWSVDDVPLLDLADALLNGASAPYEHIVVDEAQDLSPMQFESIRRRSRTGWMTVLGDLAQATSPWAPASWEEAALHLRRDRVPTEIAELSLGYRLPLEVHDVAMRLLPEIAPRLRAPQAMRSSGHEVAVTPTHPEDLAFRVAGTVQELQASGLVGVIVAQRARAAVAHALDAAGVQWSGELQGGSADVVVLAAEEAKGLEFDNVVVVEPAQIIDESPQGLRALFVALTRTTSRLTLVHAEPLPHLLGLESPVPPPDVVEPPPAPAPPPVPQRPVVARPARPAEEAPRSAPETPPEGTPVVARPDVQGSANGVAARHLGSGGRQPSRSEGRQGSPGERGSGFGRGHGPEAPGESLAALDQAMAKAIAGKLAETLARYVTPALVPLVLEEMREALTRPATGSEADASMVDIRDVTTRTD